jgi:transcriptional regulator with XRE-family HTH domain
LIRLRARRLQLGMTNATLAYLANVAPSRISELELKKVRTLSPVRAVRIAAILGIDAATLLEEVDPEPAAAERAAR